MRVLALASQKGGSGKTTLSGHLAVQAQRAGAGPVVLIDIDPQGSLADWWNEREDEYPMGPCRRAALGGMEEGGQALGLDLQKVSRQDSSRNTHALEHGPSQKRVSFLPQVDRQQLKLCVPTCPWASAGANV